MINRATKLTYDLYRPYLPRLRDRMALAMCNKALLRIFRERDEEMKFILENKNLGMPKFMASAPIECIVYIYRVDYRQIIQEAIKLRILGKIAHRFPKGFYDPIDLYNLIERLLPFEIDLCIDLFQNNYGWVKTRIFNAYVPKWYELYNILKHTPRSQVGRFLAVLGKRRWKRLEEFSYSESDDELAEIIDKYQK